MGVWRRVRLRVREVVGGERACARADAEMERELAAHVALLEEEMVARGVSAAEARRLARLKLGGVEQTRQRHREERGLPVMESLMADVRFGWRQLMKRKVTTLAAVLSLGLAMGSCVAAFRLVDALFLRPMPVSHPERLYALVKAGIDNNTGKTYSYDGFAYPDFERMRDAVKGDAELLAVSNIERLDLTYASDEEMEKGYVQYVSGRMFAAFGLQPALGRLLTEQDDRVGAGLPMAVLSYDYWQRRFGGDATVVGRSFRLGAQMYTIVGVGPKGFTGTEPGTVADYFVPTAMHRWVQEPSSQWHRVLAIVRPGVAMEPLRAKLGAVNQNFERERLSKSEKIWQKRFDGMTHEPMAMVRAGSGISTMQADYGQALQWLGVLVVMVLLIACVNVANLMSAQAQARAREMALRVAIGAGRGRLVRLVMVESALLASMAGMLGAAVAWWSAPLVTKAISTPDFPARLVLSADWRVMGFGALLILAVVMLFGLLPALQASRVRPATSLKGGEEPHGRQRLMHGMVAAQAAFCVVVLFVSGLFMTTYRQLMRRDLGFDAKNLLLLESTAPHGLMPAGWAQVGETLRAMPGVKDVAESGWPLLTASWNGGVQVNGGELSEDFVYFLTVSPNWFATMGIRMDAGRDFRAEDSYPGAAIVNEAFVKMHVDGRGAVGSTVVKGGDKLGSEIVGVVQDAPYRFLREPMMPVVFVPYHELDDKGAVGKENNGTFVVRTAGGDPMALAMELRKKVAQAGVGLRVSNAETQEGLIAQQTVRERLLAALGGFFAGVALLLAAIGLYGVLHYSVVQRERELGIRIALGAAAANIARIVTVRVMVMVLVGAVVGLAAGVGSERFVESLLYGVKGTEMAMMLLPGVVLVCAAALAAVPAVMRAVRIDPVVMLRAE